MNGRSVQVGFRDVFRFGVGVAVPALILVSGLIIASFIVLGLDVGPGITVAFTVALLLALTLELFRRYVVLSGRAVKTFRTLIWIVVVGAIPVTALLALGLVTTCYGQRCNDLSHYMMLFMFICCLCSLPMVPLGYKLLKQASWLRTETLS